MTGVASKNLYELLGNDPDQDPELRTPEVPVAPIDKPAARSGKRNAPAEAPVSAPPTQPREDRGGDRGGRGRGRGGRGGRGRDGNDQAFGDRDAGRNHNRERPTEDGSERRGGRVNRGRGYDGRQHRGGPGGAEGRSSRRGLDDRHSRSVHSGPNDQAKQAEKGWGEDTGTGELADERAGEAIAQEEQKADDTFANDTPINADNEFTTPATAADDEFGGGGTAGADEFGGGAAGADEFGGGAAGGESQQQAEPEPEDKTKSYADYLAEQAEKKLQLGGALTARQANEGATKNMPEGKQVTREETEYFAGAGPKAARQRERKEKNTVLLDHDYGQRNEDTRGGRGGRGGRGRGGRGDRGDGGGFRGDRGDRGDRSGRGEYRGRAGRGDGFRSDRGGRGRGRGGAGDAPVNVSSAADFPGLGGS